MAPAGLREEKSAWAHLLPRRQGRSGVDHRTRGSRRQQVVGGGWVGVAQNPIDTRQTPYEVVGWELPSPKTPIDTRQTALRGGRVTTDARGKAQSMRCLTAVSRIRSSPTPQSTRTGSRRSWPSRGSLLLEQLIRWTKVVGRHRRRTSRGTQDAGRKRGERLPGLPF